MKKSMHAEIYKLPRIYIEKTALKLNQKGDNIYYIKACNFIYEAVEGKM
jgi:hypothetical protein